MSPPCWVKVVRSGDNFTAYRSSDGVNWLQVGRPQAVSMGSNILVGLGVNSGDSVTLNAVAFDNVSVTSSSAPGPVITNISATTGPVGGAVTITGTGFGATQGSSLVQLNDMQASITSWSDTSISIAIPTGATSGYLAVLVAPSMNASNPVSFIVTSNYLPASWLDQDVGVVGIPGIPSYSGGAYTIQAAGTGISGATDGFTFVYQPLVSNGSITARVTGVSEAWGAQAGVMVRTSLDPVSPEVSMLAVATDVITLYESYRTRSGSSTAFQSPSPSTVSLPYWVRVSRTANMLTAYASPDGITWTQVGLPQAVTTGEGVYVGLSVTSGSTTDSANATFDNVSISVGTSLPDPIRHRHNANHRRTRHFRDDQRLWFRGEPGNHNWNLQQYGLLQWRSRNDDFDLE